MADRYCVLRQRGDRGTGRWRSWVVLRLWQVFVRRRALHRRRRQRPRAPAQGAGTFSASSVHIYPAGGVWGGGSTIAPGGVVNEGTWGVDHFAGGGAEQTSITGNFTQTDTGLIDMRLRGGGNGLSDRLSITGSATLDGTLQLSMLNGEVPNNDTFTLLTATGGIFGAFDSPTGVFLVDGHPFIIGYTTNSVFVTHVPEPMIGAVGIACLMVLRRKTRRQ